MRYVDNPITEAIVLGGLEPFDSFDDMLELIGDFRKATTDPIIIYTGYYDSEIKEQLHQLKRFSNIIVKFGRYVENRTAENDSKVKAAFREAVQALYSMRANKARQIWAARRVSSSSDA